mmetsp:Transcript_11502/g.27594  ORF Transcript_11502/g.27594 Transcript_11502/m.27594 type:complete len:440 (-) Transcript_11502:181-1500(-)
MSSEYPWVKGQGSVDQPPKSLPPVSKGRRRRKAEEEETSGATPPPEAGQEEALLPKEEDKPGRRRRRGRGKEGEGESVGAKPASDDIEGEGDDPPAAPAALQESVSGRLKTAAMRVGAAASAKKLATSDTVHEEEEGAASGEEKGDKKDKDKGEEEKRGPEKGRSFIRQGRGSFKLPRVNPDDLHTDDADPTIKMTGDAVEVDMREDELLHEKNLLYVESGADRVFHRKKKDKGERGAAPVNMDRSGSQESLKVFLDLLGALVASAFIFCQGLLGGISLLLLYLSVNLGERAFLRTFAPIASDVQKAFMFLCTVALVGSLDKWSKDKMAGWLMRGGYQRLLDATLIFLYVLCFLLTLICTPLEDVMSASDLRSPEWYRWDLGQGFEDDLANWRVIHIFRCLFGLIAWVLSSFETRNYLNNAPNKPLHDIYQKMFHGPAP